ncbi:FAD-binding oxidoreductase [Pantoea sp.]|uniref:NAD(P)/FAD-dependent oxidoreductase n=1 Tax=Pantoea sp. TaxID=69393 RepID=UPI0028A25668|nr:FAD-binding oxidoreductase [Pantoea sp.]
MLGPFVVPVHGDITLPEKVDVVVIGGGIIGCSTALEIAEQGVSVALCEKGGIGQEQSSRNWGWVRLARRDPREVPLMAESLRIWQQLNTRLGADTGYQRAGIAFHCASEQEFAELRSWTRHLEGSGFSAQMLDAAGVEKLFPGHRMQGVGALYTPDDGRAEPQKAAPAIAEAARKRGAAILTECAVRGIETQGGRVCGVITERGEIACQSVVLAGGAWSSLFAGRFGLRLPQLKVLNSVVRTAPLAGGPDTAFWARDFAIRKRQDGGYSIASGHESEVDIVPKTFRFARDFMPALRHERRSLRLRLGGRFFDEMRIPDRWEMDEPSPFEYCRVLDLPPSVSLTDKVLSRLSQQLPAFANLKVAQRWADCIDVLPDAIPVISGVDRYPGLYMATGFSGHGFGIGPAAGRLMADLVLNRSPIVDPAAFVVVN